ncbi:hypothetical protein, partial [Odoribacter splanchnicus]|uniref:hypothetical protein n=1 Tax=Odoribacter splanchnicus TaxID=28118 RepID=UPI00233004C5
VRFIPKEAFHRPVETDVIGHGFQCYIITKERINFELSKEERGGNDFSYSLKNYVPVLNG